MAGKRRLNHGKKGHSLRRKKHLRGKNTYLTYSTYHTYYTYYT